MIKTAPAMRMAARANIPIATPTAVQLVPPLISTAEPSGETGCPPGSHGKIPPETCVGASTGVADGLGTGRVAFGALGVWPGSGVD